MNAVLVVLAVVVVYLASCAIWPYTACNRCDAGKHHSPSQKNWRHCRRCKGTGRRRRVGHRVLNRKRL